MSTDCPSGPAEILENGAYGPLAPVGDGDALGEAVLSVLCAPPGSRALRKRGGAFSAGNVADRYLEVIKSVRRARRSEVRGERGGT